MKSFSARDTMLTAVWIAGAATAARAQRVPVVQLHTPDATLDFEFTRVSAVRPLRDGRVLIADAGDTRLVLADLARNTVTAVGRSGQGPNEYAALGSLFALAGDSTLLVDTRGGRWLLLDGASVAATVAADNPAIRAGGRNPLGADHGGHILATTFGGALEGTGTRQTTAADSLWVLRLARTSGAADTVAKTRARPSRITASKERVEVLMNPLAAGEQALLFADGWIAVARLEPYRVDWIAPDKRLVRGRALPEARVRVDQQVKQWTVERGARATGRPAANPDNLGEWPDVIPPFLNNALIAAPSGELWIRRAPVGERDFTPYELIDREGRAVRQMHFAEGERVVGIGERHVYTVRPDEDGIETLRRYELPR